MSSSLRSMVEVLPEECLMAIVGVLDHSIQSLFPLLLTCKTFLRLGAAVLYRSPFELLEQDHRFDSQDRVVRQRRLLRLLLSCLDESTLANLPPYHTNLESLPRHPTIDYLALYSRHSSRNFDYALTPGSSSIGGYSNTPTGAPPAGTTSITTPARAGGGGGPATASLAQARRAVHLALLSHTPSHIRTLVFSIRLMANLQPLATQLSTLSRIELYMQVKTPVDGAIHFVQAHREAFPDMLDEIKLDVTTSMSYHGSSALVRLLQAMERPRVIDVRGWPGAVQNLAQFPSAGCRVLLTRQGIMANLVTAVPPPPQPHDFAMESSGGDGSLTTAAEVPPSLSEIVSTFPKLESIRMTVNTPDFFAWAGQSRRGANSRATAMTATTITPGQPTRFLRHVRLDGFDRDLIPSLIDVARYYEQTLESLIALSRFDMRLPQYLKKTAPVDKKKKAATKASIIADTDSDAGANAATTAFGSAAVTDADRLVWTWTLPRLHTLDLEGSIAIRFDYTSLQYCPGLTDLRLNVGRRIPEDWDPQLDALVYIVQLPRLRVLDLAGYWGLTDKMIAQVLVPGLADRLHRLNLMWCRGPTQAGIEAVVRGIRALKWLGLSGETGLERDTIVSMRKVLQLESLELDISVAL